MGSKHNKKRFFCVKYIIKPDKKFDEFVELSKKKIGPGKMLEYTVVLDLVNEKVLKNDLAMYISSDEEIIELMDKIGYLEIVIKYIDGVIKSIDNRGWDIKNAIEWKKFEAGMM